MKRVLLAHGGGGRSARELVRECFLSVFDDAELARLGDAALSRFPPGQLAFTTDAFVVKPLFFHGGDIGRLAVCGTVNDLVAAGATPLLLSLSVIIEEGLSIDVLKRVARSVSEAARQAGVRVVCGDTKVVERGGADELFLTTSGVGVVSEGLRLGPERIVPGDAVIVSGMLGDHAIAVMSAREGLGFETTVKSDVAPLAKLADAATAAGDVHAMRDPTRGGLAGVLNELAEQAGVGIELDESSLPVRPTVMSACDMLGLDPLQAANEGKMAIFVANEAASNVLDAVRTAEYGADARVIGQVRAEHPGTVWMRTEVGGRRIVGSPVGELLPRIC